MDHRQRLILLTFVAGYLVIVGALFLLLPYLGSRVVVEVLGVWVLVVLAVALFAGRTRKGTKES